MDSRGTCTDREFIPSKNLSKEAQLAGTHAFSWGARLANYRRKRVQGWSCDFATRMPMALRNSNPYTHGVAILQQSPLAVEIFYSSPVRGCRLTIRSRII